MSFWAKRVPFCSPATDNPWEERIRARSQPDRHVKMITIILITILLALLIAYPLKKRTKLPPGPFPFPFLGNLPQVGLLAAKHGGIVAAMKQLKKV